MPDEGQRCRLRCPKCRSRDLTLMEFMLVSSDYKVREGRLVSREGYHSSAQGHSLEVVCDRCLHQWVARNAASLEGALHDG